MVDAPFRMFSLLESCFHLTEGVELIVVIDFNALLFWQGRLGYVSEYGAFVGR